MRTPFALVHVKAVVNAMVKEGRGGFSSPVQQVLLLRWNLFGVRLSVDWRTLLFFARHKIKPTKGLTNVVAAETLA